MYVNPGKRVNNTKYKYPNLVCCWLGQPRFGMFIQQDLRCVRSADCASSLVLDTVPPSRLLPTYSQDVDTCVFCTNVHFDTIRRPDPSNVEPPLFDPPPPRLLTHFVRFHVRQACRRRIERRKA